VIWSRDHFSTTLWPRLVISNVQPATVSEVLHIVVASMSSDDQHILDVVSAEVAPCLSGSLTGIAHRVHQRHPLLHDVHFRCQRPSLCLGGRLCEKTCPRGMAPCTGATTSTSPTFRSSDGYSLHTTGSGLDLETPRAHSRNRSVCWHRRTPTMERTTETQSKAEGATRQQWGAEGGGSARGASKFARDAIALPRSRTTRFHRVHCMLDHG
jgi:hypothetical protein